MELTTKKNKHTKQTYKQKTGKKRVQRERKKQEKMEPCMGEKQKKSSKRKTYSK